MAQDTIVNPALEKVRVIIRENFSEVEGDITPLDRLSADLGIDSLSLVDILFKVEKEFGVAIDDSDIEKIESVQDILDLVA
ncbi:acyl carrier protein [Allorhizocola rhizosphaerae]|uniref:acyl carrier protein n=1 Tax=Allorhizocola rhizosphaerae TaxID=1872709 RepID=UPI000E3C31B3|nr:acyl carrier protein [Allorhizocola rhizosphaerae]